MSRRSFEDINRAALAVLPSILERWLPGGRRHGREYVARNPTRTTGGQVRSRSTSSPAGGPTSPPATAAATRVSWRRYLFGLSQAEAARRLAEMLGVRP